MSSPTTLEYITAIGAIATPILVLLLSGIGWYLGHQFEKARTREEHLRIRADELEEKLRDYRTEIYNQILEPFIIVFTKDEGLPKEYRGKNHMDAGSAKIISLDYKQAAFKLLLLGSDEVVKAYGNLMQFFYAMHAGEKPDPTTQELMSLLGKLLLEIRRSVGNETTELHHLEMLEFMITDIRKFQVNGKYPSQ